MISRRNLGFATYLVYIVFWETLVIGGAGYAVFVLGHSGWWFALAFVLSGAAYSPSKWVHGESKSKEKTV